VEDRYAEMTSEERKKVCFEERGYGTEREREREWYAKHFLLIQMVELD
jgi:hypothetical protein